jgi:hypothetical protein
MYIIKPSENNSHYNHRNPPFIPSPIVFVFGSNLAGRHGKGAALTARQYYGAKYGVGVGLYGSSYAIPTKDEDLQILDLDIIKSHIRDFVKFTQDNPNRHFYVTAVGTGLSRFKHSDIAPHFKGCRGCWFPDIWKEYLES